MSLIDEKNVNCVEKNTEKNIALEKQITKGLEDNDFYSLSPEKVCETIVDSLHYPTVLISLDGRILYKNKREASPVWNWRRGASLKTYVDKEIVFEILCVNIGDYISIIVNENRCAVFRIDNYLFILFLTELEKNGAHLKLLYEYFINIPEKNFFKHRNLDNTDSLNEKQKSLWTDFSKRFEKAYYFSMKSSVDIVSSVFRYKDIRDHEIVNILESLVNMTNNAQKNFVFKFDSGINERRKRCIEFWFKCFSEDIGALIGIIVFLCLQCSKRSRTGRTVIKLDCQKNENIDSCMVSFSVKSDITDSDVGLFFHSNEVLDERTLYFKTARSLALKNFWCVDAEKQGDILIFKLFIQYTVPNEWSFGDSCPQSTSSAVTAFSQFMDIILGNATDESSVMFV